MSQILFLRPEASSCYVKNFKFQKSRDLGFREEKSLSKEKRGLKLKSWFWAAGAQFIKVVSLSPDSCRGKIFLSFQNNFESWRGQFEEGSHEDLWLQSLNILIIAEKYGNPGVFFCFS